MSGRKAAVISYCFLVLAFLSFGLFLGRYPLPYTDEPFFHWPAIQLIRGGAFAYSASVNAPHSDTIWAYHGPLFPWLQFAVYNLFGISQFTSRVTEHLFAHIALGILCFLLLKRGLRWAPIALPLIWMGDRASQEILLGRMEGIVLFWHACGFCALIIAASQRRQGAAIASGFCLAIANGFNPSTLAFTLAGLAYLLLFTPVPHRRRAIFGYLLGAASGYVLVLACWLPHLQASLEQFAWTIGYANRRPPLERAFNLLFQLKPSKYWFIALSITSLAFAFNSLRHLINNKPDVEQKDSSGPLLHLASLFGLAGLSVIFSSTAYPYYLVYFTVWVILPLAIKLETLLTRRKARRALMFPVAGAIGLLILWAPSAAWNGLRWREAYLHYGDLDPAPLEQRLRRTVPAGAAITGTPELYVISLRSGLKFTPLPFFDVRNHVPRDTWVLLTQGDWRDAQRVSPESLQGRRIVFLGDAFPNARYLNYPLILFAPVEDDTGSSPRK